MLPHEEPMTDSQLRYLRHLIHPSDWHTIRPSMTKREASERIKQCLWENQTDLAAVRALSASPTPVWSPRHRQYIAASSNQKQPTLADLLPPPEPEPPKCPWTRDQLVELYSLFTADSCSLLEAVRDLTEAEIDELIALAKKEREREQELERKATAERHAQEAKEREESTRRWRLNWRLPAEAPPGDEPITVKQSRLLSELIGPFASSYIHALTKKEAWALIRTLTRPERKQCEEAVISPYGGGDWSVPDSGWAD